MAWPIQIGKILVEGPESVFRGLLTTQKLYLHFVSFLTLSLIQIPSSQPISFVFLKKNLTDCQRLHQNFVQKALLEDELEEMLQRLLYSPLLLFKDIPTLQSNTFFFHHFLLCFGAILNYLL